MLKHLLLLSAIVFFFLACDDKKEPTALVISNDPAVEQSAKKAISQTILATLSEPKTYQELSWKKMRSSDVIANRIHKKALLIEHQFQSKNIYQGQQSNRHIYFIGEGKPSLLIDFAMENAFKEFLANQKIAALFEPYGWNFTTLQQAFMERSSSTQAHADIKKFIYAIRTYPKAEQDAIADALTQLNTPMSRAHNYAIILVLRLFPELMEELLLSGAPTS